MRKEFPYNREIIEAVRQKTTAAWSASLGCWYIPESNFNLGNIFTALGEVAYIDNQELQKQGLQAYRLFISGAKWRDVQ